MSFQAMAWAVRQKLPCTQKIVLVMLADRHNGDTGRCDPSHGRLAEDCGLTRRSVMDQIAKLETAGYLQITHRATSGLKASNQYRLMLNFGTQAVVNDVHIDVQDVPLVVNDVRRGSEPGAHKPVIEPVKNLKKNDKARQQILPSDFLPDETANTLAAKMGVSITDEIAAFTDHHKANGSLFTDWQAAFRTWVRNAAKFAKRDRRNGPAAAAPRRTPTPDNFNAASYGQGGKL